MEFIYVKTNTTQYMSYVSYFRLSPSCPIYHFRQKLCLSQVLQQNEKRYRNIPFPIHLWRYNSFWALASFKRHLHSSLSSACLLHSRIPKMCPSGRHPPILFLVFPLVFYYEISHSDPFWGICSFSVP